MRHIYESIIHWCEISQKNGFVHFDNPEVLTKYSNEEILNRLLDIPRQANSKSLFAVDYRQIYSKKHEEGVAGRTIEFHELSDLKALNPPNVFHELASSLIRQLDQSIFNEIKSYGNNKFRALSVFYADSAVYFSKMTSIQRKLLTSLLAIHTPKPVSRLDNLDYMNAFYDDNGYNDSPTIIADNYLLGTLSPIMKREEIGDFYTGSQLYYASLQIEKNCDLHNNEGSPKPMIPGEILREVIDCVNAWSHYVSLLRCKMEIEMESCERLEEHLC